MKKYSLIAYLGIVCLIIFLVFFIYNQVSGQSNTEQLLKDKMFSEIKILDNKFLNIFNQLNGVSFDNYRISINETNIGENDGKSDDSNSSSGGESKNSKDSNNPGLENSDSSNSQNEMESESSKKIKKFEIEETGILTRDNNVDWNDVKNQVEVLYNRLYTMTLDFYKMSNDHDKILKFNKEYDNLTTAVKAEDMIRTKRELSVLYSFLSEFLDEYSQNKKEKIIIDTKNYIIKACILLDEEDKWNDILDNINNASLTFSKISIDNDETKKAKQYNINKAYIIINEMKNVVNLKDKEIFLIKYKNLLEVLQGI